MATSGVAAVGIDFGGSLAAPAVMATALGSSLLVARLHAGRALVERTSTRAAVTQQLRRTGQNSTDANLPTC